MKSFMQKLNPNENGSLYLQDHSFLAKNRFSSDELT